jgi:hypothetical protein
MTNRRCNEEDPLKFANTSLAGIRDIDENKTCDLTEDVSLTNRVVEHAGLDGGRSVTAVRHSTVPGSDLGVVLHDTFHQDLDDIDLVAGDQMDRNAEVVLDVLEVVPALLVVDKRDRDSGTSEASGTTNPVKVGNIVGGSINQMREIIVYDQRGRLNVDTTCKNVGGDQNLQLLASFTGKHCNRYGAYLVQSAAEAVNDLVTCGDRVQGGVQDSNLVTVLAHACGNLVGLVAPLDAVFRTNYQQFVVDHIPCKR